MRNRLFDQLHCLVRVVALLLLFICSGLKANTRILEIPLALSADTRSEFATQIQLLSSGRLVVEILLNPNPAGHGFLSASIIRPDRSEAARKEAAGAFRLEYHATEPEIDQLVSRGALSWTVKVKQGSAPAGDVAGRLRITVPATPRQLVDTQFTLLGSGNAQEIPFVVPAPGKIQVTTSWETDATAAGTTQPVPLTLSLSHPGLAQTHARRQSRSPQRIEHQVREEELNAGSRWSSRIQNNSPVKVKGSIQVIFVPAL